VLASVGHSVGHKSPGHGWIPMGTKTLQLPRDQRISWMTLVTV
jgi:hypothetical protein